MGRDKGEKGMDGQGQWTFLAFAEQEMRQRRTILFEKAESNILPLSS